MNSGVSLGWESMISRARCPKRKVEYVCDSSTRVTVPPPAPVLPTPPMASSFSDQNEDGYAEEDAEKEEEAEAEDE